MSMKDLKKILAKHEFWCGSLVVGGMTLMGFGMYNLLNNKTSADLEMCMGAIFAVLGEGYYLGRQHERDLNKKNYQTKPEDYKLNK